MRLQVKKSQVDQTETLTNLTTNQVKISQVNQVMVPANQVRFQVKKSQVNPTVTLKNLENQMVTTPINLVNRMRTPTNRVNRAMTNLVKSQETVPITLMINQVNLMMFQ